MKKKYLSVLLGLSLVLTLTACGSGTKETEAPPETEAAQTEAAETEAPAEPESVAIELPETELMSEPAEELAPITPADYLVKDVDQYVTLGDLEGIEVSQYNYEVTDDMVQERIEEERLSYGDEVEVDRTAETGDIVYADMTSTVQGESDSSEESTYFTLGDAEYGEDFDAEVTGASVGDTLNFSVTFGDDIWMDEWVGQTVDFELNITSVCELDAPEYDDDYISEYTDYSSKEDYEASVREALVTEYEESAYAETVEALIDAAIERSTFTGYPDDLYDSCRQDSLALYSAFAGTTDEQEIYDIFGITAEDIEEETLDLVNRRLLVSAICEKNNLEVTEEEYDAYVADNAEYYGYDNAVQFEEDSTRDALVWNLFESKAVELIYDAADISLISPEDELLDEAAEVESSGEADVEADAEAQG